MNPRTLILGTAGHIDHGKTALLRALTGVNTSHLPEERRRGITIDLGFANLDLGKFRLGIVDVPGHERFVRNMLAGAAGIDIALVVVAADDSVMPQTREHLDILRLLGIRHGLVALTKCDRVETSWPDLVEDEIRRVATGTFLENAPIVRTAIPNDGPHQGLSSLRDAIFSVCERVESLSDSGLFRLPIDRAFSVPGRGTVVTGTVWSGQLKVRDEVEWLPDGKTLVVRGLQNHGRDTDVISRGQRAAINLIGVHHGEIVRGHELATPGYLSPSKLLTTDLQVLANCPRSIRHRSRQRLYLGTQEVIVTVALLEHSAIEPGGRGLAQLHCAAPAVASAGQPFVMRAESPLVTIGGGRILQALAPRITRRQFRRVERLNDLRSAPDADRAAAAIYFYGSKAWTEIDLCRDANLRVESCGEVIEQLAQAGIVVALPTKPRQRVRFHRDVLVEYEERILKLLGQLHARAALQLTIPPERIIELCGPSKDRYLVQAVIDRLIERDVLRGDHNGIALARFSPTLSVLQLGLRDQILATLREGEFTPPTPAEIAQITASTEEDVFQMLKLCTAQGELVHLGDQLFLHSEAEAEMRARLRESLQQGTGLTVSRIRDLLGTTRKFAVPICEHLDRIGFTRREGDLRVLR
ncbi:MAG: selenocysteine-specific translation elongation factor [Pirellulales bacterium]